jgi:hypothetical protein
MEKLNFNEAYFLKLGRKGEWEDILEIGEKARIGWSFIDLKDIQAKNWEKIRKNIENYYIDQEKTMGSTQDYNALKRFCEANENDIFITFSKSKLYWCFLDNKTIQQDSISKFRTTKTLWSCVDIKGKPLYTNSISGRISKTQAFRGTLCKVEDKEALKRLLNGESDKIVEEINNTKIKLAEYVQEGISKLHWKDYEILVDLIFRQSGWRRISQIGESLKFIDIELQDPISKENIQVQVKAKAGKKDFEEYAKQFNDKDFNKFYFVTFDPEKSLINYINNYENVEILTGIKLSMLIIDLGLTNWVTGRIG